MLLFNISMLTFHSKNVFTFEFPCTVNTSTEFTRHKMLLHTCCYKPTTQPHLIQNCDTAKSK